MYYFSSCPATSSSSKDSGSEEHIVLSLGSTTALGIPRHPLWSSKSRDGNGKDSQHYQWTNPFKENPQTPKKILKLPILEKNAEGRYAQVVKRKSVRFSSPLTDRSPGNAGLRISQLFEPAAEEDYVHDDNGSSVYGSSSSSETRDSQRSLPLDGGKEIYNEVPINMYLDYTGMLDEGNLDMNEGKENNLEIINSYVELPDNSEWMKVENQLQPFDEMPTFEHLSDVSIDQSFDSDLEARPVSRSSIRGLSLDRPSAASCETQLYQVLIESNPNSYTMPNKSLILALQKSFEDLSTLLDGAKNRPMPKIDESTTLGELFDCFVSFAGLLLDESQKKQQENERRSVNLEEERILLKGENEDLQHKLQESKREFLNDLSDSKRQIQEKEKEISHVVKSLGLSNKSLESLKGEICLHSKEIEGFECQISTLRGLLNESIFKMSKILDQNSEVNYNIDESSPVNLFEEIIEKVLKAICDEKEKLLKRETSSISLIESYKSKIEVQERKLKNFQLQYTELVAKLEKLRRKNTEEEEEILSLKDTSEKSRELLSEEMENSRNLQAAVQSLAQKAKDETTFLAENCKILERKIQQQETEITKSKEVLSIANRKSGENSESLVKKNEQIRTLQSQLRDYMKSVSDYEREIDLRSKMIGNLQKQLFELDTQAEMAKSSLEVKQEAIDLSREKCMFLEQKVNSSNDALVEKINYIARLESSKLELQWTIDSQVKTISDNQAASSELHDMLIFSFKELLDSIFTPLSGVMTDEFISQIPDAFESATQNRIPAEMSPFFARANKVVSEAIECLIDYLKNYSKSLSTERINNQSLSKVIAAKDNEIKDLKRRPSNLLAINHNADKTANIMENKRRAVSEKPYMFSNRKQKRAHCSACPPKDVKKTKDADSLSSDKKAVVNDVVVLPGR